jgi:hypothetical protein
MVCVQSLIVVYTVCNIPQSYSRGESPQGEASTACAGKMEITASARVSSLPKTRMVQRRAYFENAADCSIHVHLGGAFRSAVAADRTLVGHAVPLPVSSKHQALGWAYGAPQGVAESIMLLDQPYICKYGK